MSGIQLRIPEDLKERASMQAAKAGVSLNQYITIALASWLGADVATERYFEARAARVRRGRARAILAKAGRRKQPRPADRLSTARK